MDVAAFEFGRADRHRGRITLSERAVGVDLEHPRLGTDEPDEVLGDEGGQRCDEIARLGDTDEAGQSARIGGDEFDRPADDDIAVGMLFTLDEQHVARLDGDPLDRPQEGCPTGQGTGAHRLHHAQQQAGSTLHDGSPFAGFHGLFVVNPTMRPRRVSVKATVDHGYPSDEGLSITRNPTATSPGGPAPDEPRLVAPCGPT